MCGSTNGTGPGVVQKKSVRNSPPMRTRPCAARSIEIQVQIISITANITESNIYDYTERPKGVKIGSHIQVSLERSQRLAT
jgi:hypothetical protein